jgi:hypothetical protein
VTGAVKPALVALPAVAVALGVAAMWARHPAFFSEPRFWAEEGTVFFARAWTTPWWRMLVAVPLQYLSLYTNLAVALAASLVPLERAPLVTTLAALVAQAVPLVLLATAVAPEWRDGRRYVAMAIVLFGSLSDEIWLTSLHSHYYFTLVAFVILLEPGNVRRTRAVAYAALAGLAGLAGPVPCFLAPLFVRKAVRSRRPADVWQAAALGAATLVQVGVVLANLGARGRSVGHLLSRGVGPDPGAGIGLAAVPLIVWTKMIVLPLFGVGAAGAVGDVCEALVRRASGVEGAILFAASAIAAGLWLRWLSAGLPRRLRWPMTGGFVLIATLSILLSLGAKGILLGSAAGSSRYAYVPGVVLLLLLLQNVRRIPGAAPSRQAVVSAALLAFALVAGVARYGETTRRRATWPEWSAEVRAWRNDPRHALRLWPAGWAVRLPPVGDRGPVAR